MNVWTSSGKHSVVPSTLVMPHTSVWGNIFNFNHPVVDSALSDKYTGAMSDAWEQFCRSLEQKRLANITIHVDDAEEKALFNAISLKFGKCIRSPYTRKFGDGFWFYTENMFILRFMVESEGNVHECMYYVDISTLGQNGEGLYSTGIVPFSKAWSLPTKQLAKKPHCGHCFKPGQKGLKKCRSCQGVAYCSKACQVKHWVLDHSKTCSK